VLLTDAVKPHASDVISEAWFYGVWVNDALAYWPIGAQSHRPLATVDVFELLRVIC